ncbi:hypothetical protein [Anaerocolumna xylanovorans]|uniref:SpoIIAA-like n=1 Tax=Anaerocolumna xylanovorans DSM 12503 TaxID=1121345 RepID=A0A1M7YFU2_9FIRM|nr:hypothetical protein [Anaerocolumna xylanovorans]SHO51483.1 hypothetical protein SAMN02745217_03210 [Anaerocolumna xylanovorans DSM 12503]
MKDAQNNIIVRESFSMAYMGGEIWFCQLDALYDRKELVMEKFQKDMDSIKRPSATGLIGINLNQTAVDKEMATEIADRLIEFQKLRRVVFVGVDRKIKKVIKEQFNHSGKGISFAFNFIDDFEKAKMWLCGN